MRSKEDGNILSDIICMRYSHSLQPPSLHGLNDTLAWRCKADTQLRMTWSHDPMARSPSLFKLKTTVKQSHTDFINLWIYLLHYNNNKIYLIMIFYNWKIFLIFARLYLLEYWYNLMTHYDRALCLVLNVH